MPAFGPASAISGSHRICEICQGKRRYSGIGKNIGAHRSDGRRLAVDHAPNPFGRHAAERCVAATRTNNCGDLLEEYRRSKPEPIQPYPWQV